MITLKNFTVGIFLVLLTSISAVRVMAQGGATGAISGAVQDKNGGAVAGAKVTLVDENTKETIRTETTDSSGLFTLTLLPAGTYTIQVSATGFADAKASGIVVRVTETTRVTIPLGVKTVAEVVEVQADVVAIKTVDATTGESLTGSTIGNLPLATRNFQQLLSLSAGATSSLNSASQLGRGDVRMNVNGGRDDNNNYQIEGINANDITIGELANTPLPSPDAIQEFKVSTSLYNATQGRDGGGNINAVMKSGSADFHFDVFEYFRNTVLDANDWFLNAQGHSRPVIKQNIFGGSLGGPVSPKGKLGYFFVNYQGTRQRSGDSPGTLISTIVPNVPAADRGVDPVHEANLAADFFPGGLPAGAKIDPVAAALLSLQSPQFGSAANGFLFPLPSVPAGTAAGTPVSFVASTPGRFRDDQFTTNWDKEFRGGKDRISERFFFSDVETFEPFGAASFPLQAGGVAKGSDLNYPLDIPLRTRFGGITETHIFTPALANEFRFGVSVIGYNLHNLPPQGISNLATGLGIDRGPLITNNSYRFSFSSLGFDIGPNPANTTDSLADSLSYEDILSYTRGKHTFQFGGEFDRTALRRNLPVADNGLVFISPLNFTDFQSFLIGELGSGFADGSSGVSTHDWRIPAVSFFGQDDYRVTKSLTLNLGLRVEINGAPYDNLCHFGNVDTKTLSSLGGQPFFYPKCASKFNLGLPATALRSGLNNNWATVTEPRVGFAYDFGGHQKTSIRGGWGIYSVREDTGAVDNLSFTSPFQPAVVPALVGPDSLQCLFWSVPGTAPCASNGGGTATPLLSALGTFGPVPTASIFGGFPTGAPACTLPFALGAPSTNRTDCFAGYSGNVQALFGLFVPRHWISPTTQQWNLTVERALGKGWVLDVGYVGTHGVHLREVSDRNQARLALPGKPVIISGADCSGNQGAGLQCAVVNNTVENTAARAPLQGLGPGSFEAFLPDANSHYHGLQTTVVHRFGAGLYWQSAYTYSKSIDDTSTSSIAFDTRLNDQTNGRDSRGLSDFDHKHRFVTSFVYPLPFFQQRSDFTGRALRGWEISGVLTLQSGAPFTVLDSAGGSAYGLSSPNLATPWFASGFSCANAVTSRTQTRYNFSAGVGGALQTDAPVQGPEGLTGFGSDGLGSGSVGRNCFRGPSQKNMDFSISRNFRFLEHQGISFRTEFFNLFNHPSFANPFFVDVETPKNLGKITNTIGTPRLIQFSLRYSY